MYFAMRYLFYKGRHIAPVVYSAYSEQVPIVIKCNTVALYQVGFTFIGRNALIRGNPRIGEMD